MAPVRIEEAREVTPGLIAAFGRLVPQYAEHLRAPDADQLQRVIDAPGTVLLLARLEDAGGDAEGEIVGTLTLVVYQIPTGPRAWIEDVVVDEAHRGQGIATQLTTEALRRVRESGISPVDLTTRSVREAANRLYRNVGFEKSRSELFRFDLK